MKLYYGTTYDFEYPDLSKGREHTDFGIGFYVTDDNDMAAEWKKWRSNGHVNIYNLTLKELPTCKLQVKRFTGASEEWAKFVYNNRKGRIKRNHYDLIIGPVADNGLEDWFLKIERGEIGWTELAEGIDHRKYKSLQYCFKKENAVKLLAYVERK